jgi:hypothetical protein
MLSVLPRLSEYAWCLYWQHFQPSPTGHRNMKLLQPYTLGNLKLKNRMVMAAMTRSRADTDGIVGAMAAEYYTQRASAGLILSEAVNISADALGSPLTPGLFTAAQIAAWKKVTAAVHEQGGLIFA